MIFSLSTHLFVFFPLNQKVLNFIRQHGFKHLELWGMPPNVNLEDPKSIKRLARNLEELKLQPVSFHAPFYRSISQAMVGKWLSLCDPDPTTRSETYKFIRSAIEAMNFLGCQVMVLHTGLTKEKKNIRLQLLRENLEQLLLVAEKKQIWLALENNPDPIAGVASTTELVRKINSPHLGICFDIGHSYIESGRTLLENIRKASPKILNFHVSDNHGKLDEHNIPGNGKIPWDMVIKEIQEMKNLLDLHPNHQDFPFVTFELMDPNRGAVKNLRKFSPLLNKINEFIRNWCKQYDL